MYKFFKGKLAGKLSLRVIFALAGAGVSVFILYFWRLASLTPGLSPAEVQARSSSVSWHLILNNPVNAPYKALQHLLLLHSSKSIFLARLVSAILASIFIFCFWALCKDWFGKLIALAATILLATMPLVIILARSATPDIMYLSLLAIMLAYRQFTKLVANKKVGLILLVTTTALSLYVPGLIWLILPGLVFTRKRVVQTISLAGRWAQVNAGLLGLLMLAPLVWGIFKNYHALLRLLLVPVNWQSIVDSLKSIVWAGLSLVWRTPTHNPLILGRLPILNLTITILVIFGAFAMWHRLRKAAYGALVVAAVAIVAAGLNGNFVILTLLLPVLAFAFAIGLRYLYVEWRGVFPHNPLPKALAIFLIAMLVGMNVVYGCAYSLRAWPHSLATKQLYVLK